VTRRLPALRSTGLKSKLVRLSVKHVHLFVLSELQRPRDSDEHCDVGHGNELLGVLVGLGVHGTTIDGRPVAGGRIRPAGFVPSLGGYP
jgi:hypothetical protein